MDTSVAAAPTATVIAVNNNNNINSNNSSIGNSSSNSSSSGYASNTTTPTTPLGSSHYESQTPTPNVPAVQTAVADPIIPVATVAAVTPFYNEAITAAQTHHRQQYYQQSYVYPGAAAGGVGGGGAGAVQTQPLQQYNVYDNYSNYQHAPNVERTAVRHAYTSHAAPIEKLTAKLSPNLQHAATVAPASSTAINNVYKHETSSGGTTATTKPQAAATAFYAQPLHAGGAGTGGGSGGGGGYFDPYKYKMPTKLPNSTTPDYAGYGSHHALPTNAVAASYQQQQYYAAAKSQLQETTYGAGAVKSLNSATTRPPNISPYYGSSNTAYYDKYEKYMYTPTASTLPHSTQLVNAAAGSYPTSHPAHPSHAPPPPHHFSSPHETPTESYRKTATAWHWNMEYSAGNCRTLPPAGGGIPTATVSPTNTSYYPQAAATARDAYYAHEKYAKYDKYGPYYHQQYMPTPPTTRNAWPNAHVPHLAPPITERLPHTHPPTLQHSHSAQHYAQATASAAASAANVRQNCCSQPPYQQQSCYYPRAPPHHVGANAYPATPHPQQSHYVAGVSGNSKYGNIPDYPYSSNKLKNSNDLYVSSPFDTTPPAHLNYNYAPSTSQRYSLTGATAGQHQAVNPTATHGVDQNTAYYNDLNLHPTYDNYTASIQQQHQHHQHHIAATRTQHHLPPPPYLPPNHGKPSLLDYRKPTTTQNTDCYITQSAISNLEDHVGGNASYPSYDLTCDVNTTSTNYSNDASVDSSSDKSGTTKNLSLRDFLSTWNEDEEEYGGSEQLDFAESDSTPSKHAANVLPTEISHSNEVTQPLSYKTVPTQQVTSQQIVENHLQFKGSFNTRPKIHVGITVDSTVDVDANQYINLPDIIIDIEKSNNVAPTISTNIVTDTKAINLENFDVEKELDELQIKKANMCADKQVDDGQNCIKDSKIIEQTEKVNYDFNSKEQQKDSEHIFHELEAKQVNACETVEVNNLKSSSPTPDFVDKSKNDANLVKTALSPVQTANDTSFDNPEQFLKDIEYDNTSHSNESTFEKEYETFINKIGSDTEVEDSTKSESKNNKVPSEVTDLSLRKNSTSEKEQQSESVVVNKNSSQDELDFSDNVKEFSKFYKRKRKLIENSVQDGPTLPKHSSADTTKLQQEKTKNFPMAYTKISRKRKKLAKQKAWRANVICTKDVKIKKGLKLRKHWNSLSQYYKILHSLRRFHYGKVKMDTSTMVEQHIAMLRERHLPLIKRQSAKQYLPNRCTNYSPKTLKCLSVSILNTEPFRQSILKNDNSVTHEKLDNIDIATESDKQQLNVNHILNDNVKYVEAPTNKIEVLESANNVDEDLNAASTNNDAFVSESNIQRNEEELNDESNVSEFINDNIHKIDKDLLNIEESQHKTEIPKNNSNLSESIIKNKHENVQPIMDSEGNQSNSKVADNEINFSDSTIKINIEDSKPTMMDIEEIKPTENVESISTEIKESIFEKTTAESPSHVSEKDHLNASTDYIKIDESSITSSAEIMETILNKTDVELPSPPEIMETVLDKTDAESPSPPEIMETILDKTEAESPSLFPEKIHQIVPITLIEIDESSMSSSPEISESMNEKTNAESTSIFSENIHQIDTTNLIEIDDSSNSSSPEIIETILEKNNAQSPTLFSENIQQIAPTNLNKIDESSSAPEISECVNGKTNVESLSSFAKETNKNAPIIDVDESSSSSSDSDSSSDSNKSDSTSSSDDETASCSSSEASDFNELEALERELSQQRPFKDFSETSETIVKKTDDKFAHATSEYNTTKTNADSVETFEEITNNDIAHVKKMLESDHEELDVERSTTFKNTEIIKEKVSSSYEDDNFAQGMQSSTDDTIIAAKEVVEDVPAAREGTNKVSVAKSSPSVLDNSEPVKITDKTYDVPSLKSILKEFLSLNEIPQNNDEREFDQCEIEEPVRTTKIPKLSDLCKIALNSSFELTMHTNDSTTQEPQYQVPVECRELSVEEALAEMYRQAGVASDPEDYEQDEKEEAQDVLLINLEEILDSDSDLYVLQCDMNENILGVVTHSDAEHESENAERVNTLQLVEILNSTDFDRNDNELQLFNANDNFIMFSNNNDEDDANNKSSASAIIDENNDSLTSQFDLPTIHHEEIVPDNYKKFEKELFFKYLHEKYVQKNISKFYHANRILKKYKRRLTKNFLKSLKAQST